MIRQQAPLGVGHGGSLIAHPDVPGPGSPEDATLALIADLGFTDVDDVDGGILGWGDAGLPAVP